MVNFFVFLLIYRKTKTLTIRCTFLRIVFSEGVCVRGCISEKSDTQESDKEAE